MRPMTQTFKSPLVDIAHLLVPVLWLGLLIGVSFIATPAKFVAASLTLPVAVDVGRVTFAFFNEIEWGMFALLVIAIVLSGPSPFASGATVVIGTCLTVQTIWLLPVMNGRIADIVAGGTPPQSAHHLLYIVADVLKVGALAAITWVQSLKLLPLMTTRNGATDWS